MPSLGASKSHWPVVAWIRLKLPEPAAPIALTRGPPPPLDPPLDILERNIVTTDPRKQIYHFEEALGDRVSRLVWDSDDPELLEAELRAPSWGARPSPEEVRAFWAWVKAHIQPLGQLPVEAADPMP